MRKKIVLSMLSLALLSGTASAASGEIRFIGAVTDVTCNVFPVVNGATTNLIQLGTSKLNNSATPVDFSLKSDGLNDCGAIADDRKVNVTFAGNLTSTGLASQSGLASDAYVKITSSNSNITTDNDLDVPVIQGNDTREFAGALFKTATADGAKFKAQLFGGTKPGDYQSAIAFVVAYM